MPQNSAACVFGLTNSYAGGGEAWTEVATPIDWLFLEYPLSELNMKPQNVIQKYLQNCVLHSSGLHTTGVDLKYYWNLRQFELFIHWLKHTSFGIRIFFRPRKDFSQNGLCFWRTWKWHFRFQRKWTTDLGFTVCSTQFIL